MALAFTHLSWRSWRSKQQDPKKSYNSSSLNNSPPDNGMREPSEILKFPLVKGSDMTSSSRKLKRKWHSREERKIDREYDVVLVPSDGVCLSGSESDDSDWSIGWLEPHGPGFQTNEDVDSDTDNSFAVLVPCYARGLVDYKGDMNDNILTAFANNPDHGISADSKQYMERLLSSLQSS